MSRTPPLSKDDIDYLTQFLASDHCEEDALNIDQLGGFLWSVVASPIILQPDDWLPVIFGDVKEDGLEKSPFESSEQAERVLAIIRQLYQQANEQLAASKTPLTLTGVFSEDETITKPLSDWCQGLLMGYGWLEDIWTECFDADEGDLQEIVTNALGSVAIFADIATALTEADDSEKLRATLPVLYQQVLPVALLSYAQEGRKLNEYTQAVAALYAKTGRNDRCPCGSGKKFKQCCLV